MKTFPIADLHCDLLAYLAEKPTFCAYDEQVRCSIPQLQAGGVFFQTMAIYTETKKGSEREGARQFEQFLGLAERYPEAFGGPIQTAVAIENASAICGEDEPLEAGLNKLRQMQEASGGILYLSLTWNTENRFGGGAWTTKGLKDDGKQLLETLSELGIAVDLSHASDALAYDILDEVDRQGLEMPIIASHSNFRAITDVPRNLPDAIAREIIERGGIIGLCFVHDFIGHGDISTLIKHIAHGLKLGGSKSLAFGADFFYEGTIPEALRPPGKKWFFKGYEDASIYPTIVKMIQDHLKLDAPTLKGLTSETVMAFHNKSQAAKRNA